MTMMIWKIATEADDDIKVVAAKVKVLTPNESKKTKDPLFENVEVVEVLPDASQVRCDKRPRLGEKTEVAKDYLFPCTEDSVKVS